MALNNIILLGCFCKIEIREDDTAGGGCLVSTFHKCTFHPIEQFNNELTCGYTGLRIVTTDWES